MNSLLIKRIYAWSFVIVSLINLNSWNGFLPFATTFIIFFIALFYIVKAYSYKNCFDWTIKLWAVMSVLEVVRGAFVVELNYFSVKSFVTTSLILMLPLSCSLFKEPQNFLVPAKKWFRIGFPLFVFLAPITLHMTYYHYLCLLYIPIFFYKKLPLVYKVILVIVILFFMFDIETRSNTVRMIAFGGIGWACCSNLISKGIARYGSVVFLVMPLVFFVLGFTGTFNIFEMDKYLDKNKVDASLMIDTRTFLYYEVLTELNENNALLYGLSSAGGYNSVFSESLAEQIGSAKDVKRTNAECGIVGLALWSGLVGVICYCLLVFHSVFLAINHSKNKYMRGFALLLAFNWTYTWVENMFTLHIYNLLLYALIGMCMSPAFLEMTDIEIEGYFKSIISQTKYLFSKSHKN